MNLITLVLPLLLISMSSDLEFGDSAQLHTVSGTVQVSGTLLKTEGPKSGKDVVVYLEKAGQSDYPAVRNVTVVLDQKGLVFVPHVMAIQTGTIVDFLNSDTTDHNVFCVDDTCLLVENASGKKPRYLDLGNFPGGERAGHRFTIPGEGVMLCKLHPEMAAYIIVVDTPYFTMTSIDRESQSAVYEIEGVPPGRYVLKVWNKRTVAAAQEIIVEASDVVADITLEKKQRTRRKKK